jgi:peptidyl-tRNA hydrolase
MSANPIVQYIVVRGDLLTVLKWPIGAVIAQACHACTAVTHMYREDSHMQAYLADIDNMHKVVLEVSKQSACNIST